MRMFTILIWIVNHPYVSFLKRLSKYLKSNADAVGVCFSMKNLKINGPILNIPLFLASELQRLYRESKKFKFHPTK